MAYTRMILNGEIKVFGEIALKNYFSDNQTQELVNSGFGFDDYLLEFLQQSNIQPSDIESIKHGQIVLKDARRIAFVSEATFIIIEPPYKTGGNKNKRIEFLNPLSVPPSPTRESILERLGLSFVQESFNRAMGKIG